MAKDFFADISPQDHAQRGESPAPPPQQATPLTDRSIRNIAVPARRIPITTAPRVGAGDIRPDSVSQEAQSGYIVAPRKRGRIYIWIVAILAVLFLSGALVYFFLSDSTVTVTPRTHQITFDDTTQFTAYPEGGDVGTIEYQTVRLSFDDSATVPATGSEKAADKATGTITVYNDYSTAPVRLIKNTRFQSPGGMIFRIPASIEIPGKRGSTPGQISITVIADQPGESYNIAPADKFTLPGLKSTPEMYASVWARSVDTFYGGFSGTRPAVQKDALEKARAEVRARLSEKIRLAAAEKNTGDTLAFADLAVVTFESLPTTPDTSGSATVHERASVSIPTISTGAFARAIASALSADTSNSEITLQPGTSFGAIIVGEKVILGKDPLVFTLKGTALLVWNVDAGALASALAGKDNGAFETIIGSFSGVEKAEANIAPFWKNEFPSDVADIKVVVEVQTP